MKQDRQIIEILPGLAAYKYLNDGVADEQSQKIVTVECVPQVRRFEICFIPKGIEQMF